MKPGPHVVVIACLFLVGTWAASPIAVAQESEAAVLAVEYDGEGAIEPSGDRLYLWQSEPHAFAVTIETSERIPSGEVCLLVGAPGSRTELNCRSVSLAANTVETIDVGVGDWPENATGGQQVTVRLIDRDSGRIVAASEIAVNVFRKEGDRDADGLTNQREVAAGTSLTASDTDEDGLDDATEIEIYGTDPLSPDSDSDGLGDGAEVLTYRTDPGATDTDGDDLSDGAEVNDYGTNPNREDTDGDRLSDGAEVTTYQTDPTEVDTDGDGLGDGAEVLDLDTDPTGRDTDGDGLGDGREETVYLTDPAVADTDGDGLDDAAEVNAHQTDPTTADTDGDGLDDGAEVNTHGTNPNAADTDSDGLTDAAEVRRGTDPLRPTASPAGPLQGLAAFVTRRAVLLGVALVVLGAGVVTILYRRGALDGIAVGGFPGTGPPTESSTESNGGPAVLTNEERVRRILQANDGRMLQTEIVDAAGWSKATVSRVLSEMEANGDLSRFDIGKGNLVTLPGEEPDNAASKASDE